MRPVNLIPPEERPGERRPLRGGPLAYVIVGALAAAVIGVAALAITNNQIADTKAEIASLEEQKSAFEARAQALDAYTQFHNLREQRVATVTSLADSRFDWERVMRELSLILPDDVWLTNLTATAASGISIEGGASISLRGSISGPALELSGCASSQEGVAGFIQAVKEIDGVTRVGVPTSNLGTSSEGASASSASGTCQTRDFIAQFQLVAAFDAAPVSSTAPTEGESAVPAPAPETEAAPTETSTETTSE
jgi:Tfp pilus assembly protein PilN